MTREECNSSAIIPRTVVVHLKDTLVTDRAVVGSVRFNHKTIVTNAIHPVIGSALNRKITFGDVMV